MTASPALVLARAICGLRRGTSHESTLSGFLTPAQSGCALKLIEVGGIVPDDEAAKSIIKAEKVCKSVFHDGTEAASLLGRPVDPEVFERVAGSWFDMLTSDAIAETAAGYWLADAFLRGVGADEAKHLTDFLAGPVTVGPTSRCRSLRRYPTGGVSEKQALLLPALLRALASEFHWCSPFLIAGKLAHTGGTRDKLAVLPGFRITEIAEVAQWTGQTMPVRYFSAGAELCPRDAAMYRIRGETGTVADMGLMSASIMSKQIALPADVIVLDVLHGPTAFLPSSDAAIEFGALCESIGSKNGVRIIPRCRTAASILGRSIGASTELVEAAELLRGTVKDQADRTELKTALDFLQLFAIELSIDPDRVCRRAEDALSSGMAFDAMLTLWAEHGVAPTFINAVAQDPRAAILGGLPRSSIIANTSGTLSWDASAAADIANQQINSASRFIRQSGNVAAGGIELVALDGDQVNEGDTVAIIYGQNNLKSATDSLSAACAINSIS